RRSTVVEARCLPCLPVQPASPASWRSHRLLLRRCPIRCPVVWWRLPGAARSVGRSFPAQQGRAGLSGRGWSGWSSAARPATGSDPIEVSCNPMRLPSESAKEYVAVGPSRALRDLLHHRLRSPPHAEAYFLQPARELRRQVAVPIVLVGGMRVPQTMETIL